jgi:Mn2+/Fe2+ NRAMP family transporter
MSLFGISKYVSVPTAAVLVWAVIVFGSYQPVERLLLVFSLIYLAYPISAFMAHPDWSAVLRQSVVPGAFHSSEYFVMVVGLIGTTITPWMQFYLQASIVEKGVTEKEYHLSRWDVIGGCFMTQIVTFFIVVACGATLYVNGIHSIEDAAQAALALKPVAGQFAYLLFAVGLVNAGLLSAAILPLATTYNICEGLGLESGINRKSSEAPAFYSIYTLLVIFGAGVVLIPGMPLIRLILLSQVANGVLLPFILFYMLKLVNRHDLMGRYTNSKLANAIAISTSVIMIVLTVAMVWTTVTGA